MHTKFYTAIFKEREHSGDTVEDRMALKYDQGTQFEKKIQLNWHSSLLSGIRCDGFNKIRLFIHRPLSVKY